jgi:hypothetical protein
LILGNSVIPIQLFAVKVSILSGNLGKLVNNGFAETSMYIRVFEKFGN